MTTAEACDLLVDVLAELRAARADRAAYRALALEALHALAALRLEQDRLRDALLDAHGTERRDQRRAA